MKNSYKFIYSLVLIFSLTLLQLQNSLAFEYTINAPLSASQEVPPNSSSAIGQITGTYDDDSRVLTFTVNFTGLLSPTTAAHFHAPAPRGVNAPIVIGFVGFPVGVTAGSYSNSYVLTPAQNIEIVGGLWYVNIHTVANPSGEIRSQLQEGTLITIAAPLSAGQEVPPNTSVGLGTITGTYDDVSRVLTFTVAFTGLLSPTTAAHFHAPAPRGVNAPIVIGFAGFPVGVTAGSYSNSYTLTAAQASQYLDGLWYVNIHTSLNPGGEIRGQLDTIGNGTLPVELSSFVSNVHKNNVTLNWSTVIEVNNSGFDLQRKSSELTDWTLIGYITGYGNSNHTINYSFTDRGLNNGNYNYRLKQIDINGNFEYYNLGNEVVIGIPVNYNLSQNYPNPFNPTTRIDFDIPENSNVKLKLFDVNGREISTLLNENKPAGYYNIQVRAENFSSGVYYYTLTAGNFISTKKMIVLK